MLCLQCSANADLGEINPVRMLEILLSMYSVTFYRVYNLVNQKLGVKELLLKYFWGFMGPWQH